LISLSTEKELIGTKIIIKIMHTAGKKFIL